MALVGKAVFREWVRLRLRVMGECRGTSARRTVDVVQRCCSFVPVDRDALFRFCLSPDSLCAWRVSAKIGEKPRRVSWGRRWEGYLRSAASLIIHIISTRPTDGASWINGGN